MRVRSRGTVIGSKDGNIIKDYDMYIERSLQRGYKREDIGISKTKELRVKFKQNLRDIKDQVKQ